MTLTLSKICRFVGIEGGDERLITDICTDSRQVTPKSLYLPLKGETFDGHDFIPQALEKGAAAVLSEREGDGEKIFRVDSTLRALGAIAAGYRSSLSPKVVGITGSVGKTTTKDMIAHVLSSAFVTHKTQGNFNNEIGLPKTLFALEPEHQAAVVEMGMSHKGEISRLTRIARPDIAVITNIGSSHIEYLGSREGIRDAKLEIVEGLPENGLLVMNGDEPLLIESRKNLSVRVKTFGIENAGADYHAENIVEEAEKTTFTLRGIPFTLYVIGRHHIMNAMAAAAVGENMGMTLPQIAKALESFVPQSAMRQAVNEIKEIKIITDCYNASPESMHAGFSVCRALPVSGRRFAVLGVMRELGDYAPALHAKVGEEAKDLFDRIFVFGKGAEDYIKGAPDAILFETHEELTRTLLKEVREGDLVLFKGSRLNYLEKVAEAFQKNL